MSIERITEYINGCANLKEGTTIETAIDLLAKYEDTTLAPNEIASKAILAKMHESYNNSMIGILKRLTP